MKTKELYQQDYRSLPLRRRLLWLWYWWSWRFVLWLGDRLGRGYWWNGGRRYDADPTVCPGCGRVWRVRDLCHGYDHEGEPESECPHCGDSGV